MIRHDMEPLAAFLEVTDAKAGVCRKYFTLTRAWGVLACRDKLTPHVEARKAAFLGRQRKAAAQTRALVRPA